MTHHVYHLVCPRDRAVRYVGQSRNPRARLRSHIRESRQRQNTDKKRWISNLLSAGMEPVLVIAGSHATEALARQQESDHCHRHLATIYNIHDPRPGARDLRRPKEGDE